MNLAARFIVILTWLVILQPIPSLASSEPYETFLPKAIFERLEAKGAVVHNLIYGWCMSHVRGSALTDSAQDPYGSNWSNAPRGEVVTKGKFSQLRINQDGTIIVNLEPDNSSCYVQVKSLATPLVIRQSIAELDNHMEDLSLVTSDSARGYNSSIYALAGTGEAETVVIQLHAYFSPQEELIIAIVQQVPKETGDIQ
jgi:hypothetical protein